MYYLKNLISEYDGFSSVVNTALKFDRVHGVMLELDPFWHGLWMLDQIGIDFDQLLEYIEFLDRYSRFSPRHFWRFLGDIAKGDYLDNILIRQTLSREWKRTFGPYLDLIYQGPPIRPLRSGDLYWRPPFPGGESIDPLITWVNFFPGEYRYGEYGRDREYDRNDQIPSYRDFADYRISVRLDSREPIRFNSDSTMEYRPLIGGISTGGRQAAGTLGGILHDNRDLYAITCSHLFLNSSTDWVTQPARQDWSRANDIGQVIYKSPLVELSPGQRCDPWGAGKSINELDYALIRIAPYIKAKSEILDIREPIRGFKSRNDIDRGDRYLFRGRVTERKRVEGGFLGIFQEIHHRGKRYCFRHLCEAVNLDPESGEIGILNKAEAPFEIGDSGGWLVARQKGFNKWAGMNIGGDNKSNYWIPAESILLDIEANTGLDLKVGF